jgi:hypothetical protein
MDERGASLAVAKAMVPRTVLTRIVTGASLLAFEVCTQEFPESAAAWAMFSVLVLFLCCSCAVLVLFLCCSCAVLESQPGSRTVQVVCVDRGVRVWVARKNGRAGTSGPGLS